MNQPRYETTGRATEAHELLFGCLRFRNPNGGEPIPYDEKTDDRDPVSFVFPPDKSFSDGANQLWNTIVSLPMSDIELSARRDERDEVIALLRSLLNATDADTYRLAVVAATRWLTEWDHQDDDT